MIEGLAGTPNFRDLGGLPAIGGVVRKGVVFRSEAIIAPGPIDAAALAALGIVLVCDLRGQSERDHKPNTWWAEQGIELLELDILADIRGSAEAFRMLRDDPSSAGGRSVMLSIYSNLPKAAAPHLATIFQRIAAGDVPMLIHCTAGKDRTGFLSAMILHALGVSDEAIVADYLSSGARLSQAVVDATRRLIVERAGDGISEGAMAAVTGVEADYLEQSMATIRAEHGSIDAYLRDATGLDRHLLTGIKTRLLA